MTTAFVFPGQGSQSLSMLSDLASNYSVVTETFAQASEELDYDLWQLVQQGPEDALNETDKTQPAMLAAGVAVWRVWSQEGGKLPSYMAGHSLGEYTALVCANALNFADAVKLVEDRGRFMQDAVATGEGAMAAILGMEDDAVVSFCETNAGTDVLEAVNFNSPGQVVIAGNVTAVNRAIENAKEAGAKKAVLLPVSVPSHCALMKPAAENLQNRLTNLNVRLPSIPVLHNANAQISESIDEIKANLVAQLYQPVQWVSCVNFLLKNNVETIIECGPGKVLAGLNKRISRKTPALPVFDVDSLQKALSV